MGLFAGFNHHHKIHPLIIKVEEQAAPPPVIRRYVITDQLSMGPFKFKINYRADIFKATEDEVHTEAFQSPGVHVINHSFFAVEGSGTRMKEEVTIEAPDLLFGYTFLQAKDSHKVLLERIKQVMESRE